MDFREWILENNLSISKIDKKQIFKIKGCVFKATLLISEKDEIFGVDMDLHLDDSEMKIIEEEKVDSFVFRFGRTFYINSINQKSLDRDGYLSVEFNEFRNIGQSTIDEDFTQLAIHTEYELCNGTGTSSDWVKKAKFNNNKSLAICEKNSLAGVLPFQLSCSSNNIKSIICETITVAYKYNGNGIPFTYEVKVYVKNYDGWFNLLKINKEINVVNGGDKDYFIDEKKLFEYSENLILVFSKESRLSLLDVRGQIKHIKEYKKHFKEIYFQIDSVVFYDDQAYNSYASTIKSYLQFYSDMLEPILISDSFYIEKIGAVSRKYVNGIGGKMISPSDEQHFRNLEFQLEAIRGNYKIEKSLVHKNGLNFKKTIKRAIKNTRKLSSDCNFEYEIGKPRIPEFEFDGNKDKLLKKLLKKGMKKKVLSNSNKKSKIDEYKNRLKIELDTVIPALLRDYFLIHWDFIKKHKEGGKLVGIGRGSVGGSLIAYLLDITNVDPIEFNLLFERFLNKTRVEPLEFINVTFTDNSIVKIAREDFKKFKNSNKKKIKFEESIKEMRPDSLPDIDIDFTSEFRHEIKRYFEDFYGDEHVVSVGTYNRLKPKSAIKGFGRVEKMSFFEANTVSKQINNRLKFKWGDIFIDSQKSKILKKYVKSHHKLIEAFSPVMNNASIGSIHASATVVTPKTMKLSNGEIKQMTVFDWIPVKKVFDNKSKKWVLVSEWEGKFMDKAGMLKEDILGLSTLDKFMYIIGDVKKNRNIDIILDEIPLNCKKTYEAFQGGFTEDVFQFNSSGMKQFCRLVKPDDIEDLIAMNALYRPGPMGLNSHTNYAAIKHGKREAEFDYGLEEVTKNTHGLIVYQEQIMQATVAVGGFSLVESDTFRTAIKKFQKDVMESYKSKFVDNYVKYLISNNHIQNEKSSNKYALGVWDKIIAFSAYGFNRSHSAAYGIMAYWTQYLKVNFPEEFYACALHHAQKGQDAEYDTSSIIDEIESRKLKLKLEPPHINNSTLRFETNVKRKRVYWSLVGIKGIGVRITEKILTIRESIGGEFSSIDEFYNESKRSKSGIGRAVVEKMILAGAFDSMYSLSETNQRLTLMEHLFINLSNEVKAFHEKYGGNEYKNNTTWSYIQKTMTGYGKIDYKDILSKLDENASKLYLNASEFLAVETKWKQACIAGKILFIVERNSKKGKFGTITLESNDKQIVVTIWSDVWSENKEKINKMNKDKKLFAMTGKITMDNYRGHNCLYSDLRTTKIFAI